MEKVSKCNPLNCNRKGICNNVGNCHCIIGYGGDDCNVPGYGGSVNSGPASDKIFNASYVFMYIFFVALIIFAIATYYYKKNKGYWLHKKLVYFCFTNILKNKKTIRYLSDKFYNS